MRNEFFVLHIVYKDKKNTPIVAYWGVFIDYLFNYYLTTNFTRLTVPLI